MKRGNSKTAKQAYERAVDLAADTPTRTILAGAKEAGQRVKDQLEAIRRETDIAKSDALDKAFLDQDWSPAWRYVDLHSLVHERQAEGLIAFAQRIGWPHVSEFHHHAEGVYANIRAGKEIPFILLDWIMGLVLPGQPVRILYHERSRHVLGFTVFGGGYCKVRNVRSFSTKSVLLACSQCFRTCPGMPTEDLFDLWLD